MFFNIKLFSPLLRLEFQKYIYYIDRLLRYYVGITFSFWNLMPKGWCKTPRIHPKHNSRLIVFLTPLTYWGWPENSIYTIELRRIHTNLFETLSGTQCFLFNWNFRKIPKVSIFFLQISATKILLLPLLLLQQHLFPFTLAWNFGKAQSFLFSFSFAAKLLSLIQALRSEL